MIVATTQRAIGFVILAVVAIGFVVINFFVDLLYGWLDPRVRST